MRSTTIRPMKWQVESDLDRAARLAKQEIKEQAAAAQEHISRLVEFHIRSLGQIRRHNKHKGGSTK